VLRAIEWILYGTAGVTSILGGLRWHRPARIGPWLLLAGAVACLSIGDVFYAIGLRGVAEPWYLALFVLVSMSMLQLTRGGALLVDRARLIDLLAFTCSALLVVWVFVIGDSGRFGNVSAADVIGDLLLVGVSARVIIAAGRNWSAILLCIGAVGMLAGDIAYPLAPGPVSESGYRVLYLAWGAAALHPSMARLTTPASSRYGSPWQSRWSTLLGLSVATPPVVLLIEAISGSVRDGVVIAVAGGLTLMLTITRLADAASVSSRAVLRETGLREASAALVGAADLPAVDQAVRAAVTRLMPPDAIRRIVFAADDRQLTAQEGVPPPAESGAGAPPPSRPEAAAPSSAGPSSTGPSSTGPSSTGPSSTGPSSTGPSSTGPSSAGPSSAGPSSAGPSSAGPSSAGETTPWARTGSQPAGEASRPRSWWLPRPDPAGEATLVCPLWLEPLAVARPSGGALVLTGRYDVLAAARDVLEVLAGQAALALDRISLVEAVGRRDSDLYLRAVIRNTADIMLVIDEDQRIRYASPTLRELIGVAELPPLATLTDLIQPPDRTMVRQALQSGGDGTLFCPLERSDGTPVLVEATYRDLRGDRLVQGFVVTMRTVVTGPQPDEQLPHLDHLDELPAWVNRRSAQHKFRY
jgi:PAS domain-containing protein